MSRPFVSHHQECHRIRHPCFVSSSGPKTSKLVRNKRPRSQPGEKLPDASCPPRPRRVESVVSKSRTSTGLEQSLYERSVSIRSQPTFWSANYRSLVWWENLQQNYESLIRFVFRAILSRRYRKPVSHIWQDCSKTRTWWLSTANVLPSSVRIYNCVPESVVFLELHLWEFFFVLCFSCFCFPFSFWFWFWFCHQQDVVKDLILYYIRILYFIQ